MATLAFRIFTLKRKELKVMQDRFKLRAWDSIAKEYIFDSYALYELFVNDIDDSYQVEQCTGLEDKNGKLIYEGDIVSCNFSGKANTAETFAKKVFQGKHIVELCEYYFAPFNCVNASDLEVIGNIHENPELLEDNK